MTTSLTLRRAVTPLIPAFVVLGFFVWFSNWIPQTRWEPPQARTIDAKMTPAELARLGGGLVRERGCLTCHTIEPGAGVKGQGRGPNLAGLASRRATGVSGGPTDLVDYLTQSLYEPGAYLVEGYASIMPAAHRPPSKLNFEEVTAVVDYLMSLGGTPAVKVGDLPRPPSEAGAPAAGAPEKGAVSAAPTDPKALLQALDCVSCHSLTPGEVLVGPPFDPKALREKAAARGMSLEGYLIESIIQPRAFVGGDFPPDLMPPDYGTQMTAGQLHTIVTYLASLAPESKSEPKQ